MSYKTYEVRIHDDGTKAWYLNGELHREDGPAIEWSDDTEYWYLNGKRHREDGPAVEYSDGVKHWYLNDKELTKKEFNRKTRPSKSNCAGKIVTIDGKKYRLEEVENNE